MPGTDDFHRYLNEAPMDEDAQREADEDKADWDSTMSYEPGEEADDYDDDSARMG